MNIAQIAFWMFTGAALLFAGRFGYLWAKKGTSWAVAKLKAWWSKGKADLASFEARLGTVEAEIAKVKTKIGL